MREREREAPFFNNKHRFTRKRDVEKGRGGALLLLYLCLYLQMYVEM